MTEEFNCDYLFGKACYTSKLILDGKVKIVKETTKDGEVIGKNLPLCPIYNQVVTPFTIDGDVGHCLATENAKRLEEKLKVTQKNRD